MVIRYFFGIDGREVEMLREVDFPQDPFRPGFLALEGPERLLKALYNLALRHNQTTTRHYFYVKWWMGGVATLVPVTEKPRFLVHRRLGGDPSNLAAELSLPTHRECRNENHHDYQGPPYHCAG